ncbi:MAG: zinc ribbon domain-containing protein, partial [Promethearchaeota archaeon]
MVETVSKSQDELFCPNCHSKLPKELTQKNEKGDNFIFCPYCGTQITLKSDIDENEVDKALSELSPEIQETNNVKFSLTDKEIHHIIRIFIYRNIYQMIKRNKSIMRRLISQKDLSKSQISYLTSKIRNTLLNTSNPLQGAPQELTNPAIRKLDTFYKKFTTSLNNKKTSRDRNFQLLAENVQFTYNLIRGDYTFEDLSETKRKIILDLKQFFGFKEEMQSKKSMNYNISLFFALKIYSIIKQNKNVHLNKSVIDEITNTITELVIHDDFRN